MTDTPKLWRDMTPEEKGALLLAHHEGKVIEASDYKRDWHPVKKATWFDEIAYRIKPEPKRETNNVYAYINEGDYYLKVGTIDLIDGKPDPASIKIEET